MHNLANRIATITAEVGVAIEARDPNGNRVLDRELVDCLRELLWAEERIRFELTRRELSNDHVGHQDRRA